MVERLAAASTFQFSEADLEENRKGRLSDAQAALLRKDALNMAGLVCSVILAALFLALISAQGALPDELQGVGLAVFAIIGVAFYFYIMRTSSAVRPRIVQAISGEVTIGYQGNGYRLRLGTTQLPITAEQARSLMPGVAYTLYVVPGINKIVAVEALVRDMLEIAPTAAKPVFVQRVEHDEREDVIRA